MPDAAEDSLHLAPLRLAPLPADPLAVVLMLHGGAEHGLHPIDDRSLAPRRTAAMFRSIAPRLAAAGVATARLRFTVKGWNASTDGVPSPVIDTREAVARLRSRFPDRPVVIIGHSMGARTAAWAADSPGVIGVVGLAPWFPGNDPVDALRDKHLVAAHGRRDKITNARQTRRYVESAAEVAATAEFVDMGNLGHYMLRGARAWNNVAVTSTLGILGRAADRAADRPDRHDDVGGVTHGN